MTSKTRLVYLLITTFCLAGCGYKSRNPVSENGLSSADTIQTALAPRYAKGFKITVRPDGVKLLSISEPNNNHAIYKPQNKMFHFCKTFCSKITLVNTIQNVI